MKIVVTGASGHVGGNLVRELVEEHEVTAVVHSDMRALEDVDVRTVSGDVLDRGSMEKACEGAEIVLNLAAHISITGTDGGRVDDINVRGVRNVAETCMEAGVRRLVHFSSVHAFCQEPLDQAIDETRPLADTTPAPAYDRSKARGEREVLACIEKGLDAVIVNPSSVLGPHDYKLSRMGDVLLRLYRRSLPALVPGGYDWVDVRDVVDGTIRAMERGRTGERYILSGHWLSVRDLAGVVENVTGRKKPRMVTPLVLARIGAPFVETFSRVTGSRPLYTREAIHTLMGNSHFSHAKATDELGYEPRPIRETIEATFDWFRVAGWLD
jgi:dihydroflavonol-4-reductase